MTMSITTTRQIQRIIADKKSKITAEELFSSPAYRNYLQNIADNVSAKYGRGAVVRITYMPNDEDIAYTDNFNIHINTANQITNSFSELAQRNLSCIGLIGHECGHILYTDFKFMVKYVNAIGNGKFYPKKPSTREFPRIYQQDLQELTEVFDEKNPAKIRLIAYLAKELSNRVEDGYIEYRLKLKFPGTVSMGITLNNVQMLKETPSVQEMVDNGYEDISIMFNLILEYCLSGKIKNQENISNEYTNILVDCIPCLDEALSDNNSKSRMAIVNKLLVFNWKFVKKLLDKIPNSEQDSKQEEENSNQNSGQAGSQNSNQNSEQAGSQNSNQNSGQAGNQSSEEENSNGVSSQEKVLEELLSNLAEQMQSNSVTPQNMSTVPVDNDEENTENTENPKRLKHEQTKIEEMLGQGSGTTEQNNDYIAETIERDFSQILNRVASEQAYEETEKQILEELESEKNGINFGNIHKNVDVVIHRQRVLNGTESTEYDKAMRVLRPVSKMLQKTVANIIKQRHRGSTERGLYMGSRLDSTSYYRNDGKIFTKRNRPNDEINLAVGVLIDQSGSMEGIRIEQAQATALIVYDFCTALNIPVTIYGHDYDSKVNLYSYAEFDSVDGNDKYRLMNMTDLACNRDGCAVRYVAEKLNKRNEATKLLIVVSDGQPYADTYYGTGAEEDLKSIRKEYTRKGITLLAAAIGDDKEAIKRCYGEQAFLDITDLQKFPITIAKLIAKYAVN